jgi:Phytanoyl-CoA dioxygenase (PhyH)
MDQRIMTGILQDEQKGLELAQKGYSIFPFLDTADIDELSKYYFDFQKEAPNHFYSSTHSPDFSFRRRSSEFIKQIVSNKVSEKCKNFKLLGGAFVVKPANGKGILPPHQDWNIVDESITRSYNIWIPLVDVTIENGAVFVLTGSHNKLTTYRGPGIPSIFQGIETLVWESLQPLPMKAGEALFYDHALLHASPVNQSNTIRLGIVCGIIPSNASMQLYFNENGVINAYRANEDFFLEKDPMKGPDGLEIVEQTHLNANPIGVDGYNSLFLGKEGKGKKGWFSKLFGGNK